MTSAQAAGASYRYDPFGRIITSSGTVASANAYRFSSKQIQPLTGFYYYGYRFYDPSSQRWVNRDPAGEHDGPNLYGFVHNDSINRSDAYGLKQIMFNFDGDHDLDVFVRAPTSMAPQIQGVNEMLNQCRCTVSGFPNITATPHFERSLMASPNHGLIWNSKGFDSLDPQFHFLRKGNTFVPVIVTKYVIDEGSIGIGRVNFGILIRETAFLWGKSILAHELGHYAGYKGKSHNHAAITDNLNLMHPHADNKNGSRKVGEYPDPEWCDKVKGVAR